MFNSLYKVQVNWKVFFIILILTRLLLPEISWLSYVAIVISLHQFFLLFYSINYVIPIRYLFGILMCLQIFIGPVLAYNGLDKFQFEIYKMKVPEEVYFAYTIPAILFFILGLHFKAGKLKGEYLDLEGINGFSNSYYFIAYVFIAVGFLSSFVSEYFLTSEVRFIFYLISNFKFIGAFMVVLERRKLKPIIVIIIAASLISSSLLRGLFHDLLTWLMMLGAVFAIRYKPSTIFKLIFLVGFVLLVIVIQQLKGGYRAAISRQEAGITTFAQTYEQRESKNRLFNPIELAKSNVRINQGFIITYIMKRVPERIPFANGSEIQLILNSAFLPRVLAPNKLQAGDEKNFNKYTGIKLGGNTSMALSSVGDAYIDFGILGGTIFMFILGLFYNTILKYFHKFSLFTPLLLLFTPLVFYFPIRPDSDLHTNLGHLVKSCILIFFVFLAWRQQFLIKQHNNSN